MGDPDLFRNQDLDQPPAAFDRRPWPVTPTRHSANSASAWPQGTQDDHR